jgi:outer membrane protein assembly factor BamD
MRLKVSMVKQTILLGLVLIFYFGCGGKRPEPNWTAEEYFHYAKAKYDDEDYFEAVNDFTVVILRFAGSTVADSAQFYLASSHFYMKEYIISSAEYEKLINNMAQSPLVSESQYMLAESYYQLSPRAALDQEYSIKALREFQSFIEEYPLSVHREDAEKKIIELRDKLADKEWRNAELYRRMQEYNSSLIYYDLILERYYDTDYAEKAQYGKALVYLAMKEYQKAQETLLQFKNKYPASEFKDAVDKNLQKANEQLERQEKK